MTNLTDTNMNLETQVDKYANHLVTKDSDMAALTKKIIQIQGGIKNLKRKLASQHTKITGAIQKKEANW